MVDPSRFDDECVRALPAEAIFRRFQGPSYPSRVPVVDPEASSCVATFAS